MPEPYYNLEVSLSVEQVEQMMAGVLPNELKDLAFEIFQRNKHPTHRFFKVTIRQVIFSYEVAVKVDKVLLDVHKYTPEQVAYAAMLHWYDNYDLTDFTCINLKAKAWSDEITLQTFEALALTLQTFEASVIDLLRALHYCTDKEPFYWHLKSMPHVLQAHGLIEDNRYLKIEYQVNGEDKLALVPYLDATHEKDKPTEEDLSEVLFDRWNTYQCRKALGEVKNVRFDLTYLYDRFGRLLLNHL